MPNARLTSKGQITVPKQIREALGLRTGDSLAFRVRGDGLIVVENQKVALETLRGALRPKVKGVTVEAMNEAIRRGHKRR